MQRNVISIFTYLARVGEQLAGVQGDGGLGIAQVERAVVRDIGTLGRHVDRDLGRLAVYEERVSVREETGTLSVFQGCLLQEAVVALETSTHRTRKGGKSVCSRNLARLGSRSRNGTTGWREESDCFQGWSENRS